MQKKVLLFVILFFIASLSLVNSADEEQIAKAYSCLESKVIGKCSNLSPEEKAFSLLTLGECKQELIDSAKKSNGKPQCWPSSSCDIDITAKALLSLYVDGSDTSEIENWLLTQKTVPGEIDWFLQIESNQATTCEITYSNTKYTINIGLDKKINTNAGTCLKRAQDNYWLQIDSSCRDKQFAISCDKSFLTNLLYKDVDSPTIFVSEETHSAAANGGTIEEINSFCFKQGSVCDYEGSLWATFVLDYVGYSSEMDYFIPYLVASASNNLRYLPDAFLYHLLGDTNHQNTLLQMYRRVRDDRGYWQASSTNNKFYDTAVALYFLQGSDDPKITNAKKYLLTTQDAQGCWEGNVRNTAFILHSAWQGFGCNDDLDCGSGQICKSRLCVDGCRDDDECGLDKICNNVTNACVNGCIDDNSCSDGKICKGSPKQCVLGCREDNECGAGKICNNNTNSCIVGCRDSLADCDPGYICNNQNTCVKAPDCTQQNEATTCGLSNVCVNGVCKPGCRDDNTCADGFICNASKSCVEGCRLDGECGDGRICLNSTNKCVDGCRTDTQCGEGKICNVSLTCVVGCKTNQQCLVLNTTKDICMIPGNICVQCLNNSQCNNATEKCMGNECIPKQYECVGDSHCTNSSKPVCVSNACVRCRYNEDCGNSSLECANNTCVVKPQCRYDSDCNITTQICDTTQGKCVQRPQCVEDIDCSTGQKCESGRCIRGCRDDNNCALGEICLNNTCGTGCRSDNSCPSDEPYCTLTNICVECESTNDCWDGYICSNNDCVELEGNECEFDWECDDGEICNADGVCVEEGGMPRCEEDKDYFCRSRMDCGNDGGTTLDDLYECNVPTVCCNIPPALQTCDEMQGEVCSSTEICDSGTEYYDYADSRTGEICCVGGSCEEDTGGGGGTESPCLDEGGICRSSCLSDEEEMYRDCVDSSEVCCISGTPPDEEKSYLWLWILLILILLAVVAFIFREKLRIFLMRMRGKKGPPKGPPGFPGMMPPPTTSIPMRRPIPRRILPPTQRPISRPQPLAKPAEKTPEKTSAKKPETKSELDDVLKKLKDIGK